MEDLTGTPAAPYTAVQIANEFIARGVEDGITDMTNMKIQKLVYFAHGFFLAKYRRPLIQEDFVVWKHGPVVRLLYIKFKEVINQHSWESRHSFCEPLRDLDNPVPQIRENDNEAIAVINSVWRACKNHTANYLSLVTHSFDSPWTTTLAKKGPKARISNSEITRYFQSLMGAK